MMQQDRIQMIIQNSNNNKINSIKQTMSGFDSTKNSIDKLKLYLKRMQYNERNPCSPSIKDLDEHIIKQLNNDLFLPLVNYILIDYSAEIYIEILDRIPDIKYKDDRKFVEDVINLSREMFKMGTILSVQQFLSNKYIDKKLQFVSTLAQNAYNRVETTKKSSKNKDKQPTNMSKALEQYTKTNLINPIMGADQLDDQQQVPMVITAVPMKIDVEQFKNKSSAKQVTQKGTAKQTSKMPLKNQKFVVDGEEFDQRQIQKALQERHPTPLNTRKPVEEPLIVSDRSKNAKSYYYEETYQEDENDHDHQYDKFRLDQNKNKVKNIPYPYHTNQQQHQKYSDQGQKHSIQHQKHPQHSKYSSNKAKDHQSRIQQKQKPEISSEQPSPTTTPRSPSQETITRGQFNELVSLIRVVSETVNQISHKFGELQANVNTQINTINARVLMLESSVRLIKDNL